MYSVNFILGLPERDQIQDRKSNKPVALWEGEGVYQNPFAQLGHTVTYYANAKIHSARTERDEMQVVGKLYTGRVDD